MFSLLNEPFPIEYDIKKKLVSSLLIGLFVSLFLFLFKPFGIDQPLSQFSELLKYSGYGIVSFLGVLFVELVIPLVFPSFFDEDNYKVKSEIVIGALIVLVIALGNLTYLTLTQADAELSLGACLTMVWQTFLVGLFPMSIITLLRYTSLLRSNAQISAEINLDNSNRSSAQLKSSDANQASIVKLDPEHQHIDVDDLLYIESKGNYVNVKSLTKGKLSKTLYRKTMKSVEKELMQDNLQRCHRSFIVNLDKVTEISGNAQGLKLSLNNCDELIPVSRKYISEVKNYFA